MSIAAANLLTRNIYKACINPDATPPQEAKVSKIVSLVVKFGALVFVLGLGKQNAINFQLLGGVWILQTLPGDRVRRCYTRWFHRWALLAGWAVGMVYGTLTAYNVTHPGKPAATSAARWRSFPGRPNGLHRADRAGGQQRLVASCCTLVLRALKVPNGAETYPQRTTTRTPAIPGVQRTVDESQPVH